MSDKDPFSGVSKRRETRLQAFRDFFSGKKSKSKLGTSDGKGLGSSGGLSYGSLEETINRPDEEVRLSPVHEHIVDADNIVGEAEFYQARPFSDKKGQRITEQYMPYREEHEPYGLRDDGIICVSKAYLYEIHPINQTLKRHALEPLQISVSGEGVVYTMYKTDNHGKVKVEEAEEGEESEPSYTLMFGEELPNNTDYILPDENGSGTDGEYYTPICYIKNSKLEAKQFQDGRQAQVRGSLEGHRGPLWWIAGYDAIKNVGVGQKIYKNYTEGDDFKNLRSISQLGQTQNCSGDNRVSGEAQVKVSTNGDTINVHGNRYNKTWKVGDKKQAIVEDGLVRCLGDLPVETLSKKTLQTASVLQAASGTQAQAASADFSSHKQTAWTGGNSSTQAHTGYTPVSVLPEPTTGDKINVWNGGSTQDGYVGGSLSQVATSSGNRSDVCSQGSNSNVVTATTTGYSYTGGSAAAIYTVDAGSVQGWAGGSVGQVVTGSSAGQAWQGGTTAAAITSVGSGNAWTGGASASNNIVVSANDENDFVRGGVKTEAAGIPLVAIPIEFGSEGQAIKWVWVMGYETQTAPTNNNAPTFPNFLTDGTNQTFTPFGYGVESVNLGQGIVGTDIASNAFHNSVDTTASVPSGATLQNVITATTTGYGITRIDGDGHDSFTQPNFAVNPTAVTGVLKDLQAQTVLTSATTTPNGIVGASQVSVINGIGFNAGGVIGATQKNVIADSGSDTVGEIKVLKADTMTAISDVVSAPTTDPVVANASLTTEFIKATLPSVNIPNVGSSVDVYKENTDWSGDLLESPSSSTDVKVVIESTGDSCDSCS